jgi:uncharacterized protein with NRDE domain
VCLIALFHAPAGRYPLVIAANRDEDYERATHDAHVWNDAPEVVGGKDALYGGSWLAVRRGGRFAAVTNLRGAERRTRSRGFLVRDFVTTDMAVSDYAASIVRDAADYAGFHLLAGDAGGEMFYIAPGEQRPLEAGVHAFSNAPSGESWPKTTIAADAMERSLSAQSADVLVDEMLRFLSTPRGTGIVESEVFIAGDRYGTRSSAVIVATADVILFAEQSYARGGIPRGARRLFRLPR